MSLADDLRSIANDLDAAEERANTRLRDLLGMTQAGEGRGPVPSKPELPSPAVASKRAYLCGTCGRSFSYPGARDNHAAKHERPVLRSFGEAQ